MVLVPKVHMVLFFTNNNNAKINSYTIKKLNWNVLAGDAVLIDFVNHPRFENKTGGLCICLLPSSY